MKSKIAIIDGYLYDVWPIGRSGVRLNIISLTCDYTDKNEKEEILESISFFC